MIDLSDPISRQQAITALRVLSDEDGYINVPHEVVTDVVRGLAPVRAEQGQTTRSEQGESDKLASKMGKTWVDVTCPNCGCEIHVESEIVRCKDCKYRDENWRRVSVRWLPCSERLPEVDETVLVTTAWGDVTIAERIYQFINDINNICWFIHDDNTNATFDDVVAWMPLPGPYQAERWEE